jgi:hypothetical protein
MRQAIFVIALGIVLWIIALVFAIVMKAEQKIISICIVGALLGVIGLRYTIRRGRRSQL